MFVFNNKNILDAQLLNQSLILWMCKYVCGMHYGGMCRYSLIMVCQTKIAIILGHSKSIFNFWSSAHTCFSWFNKWGLRNYLCEFPWRKWLLWSYRHSWTTQTPLSIFRGYYRDVIEQQVNFLVHYESKCGYKEIICTCNGGDVIKG